MTEDSIVQRVRLDLTDRLQDLFGERDENLDWLEKAYGVQITVRDEHLVIRGPAGPAEKLAALLRDYQRRAKEGSPPTVDELRMAAQLHLHETSGEEARDEIRETLSGRFTLQFERKSVAPKDRASRLTCAPSRSRA